MSLFKIDKKLQEYGLSKKKREHIIEMVRQFGMAVLERNAKVWK